MNTRTSNRHWWFTGMLIILLCGLPRTSLAGVPPELQPKLDAEVAKEMDEAIARITPADYVARELFLEPPVVEPEKKIDVLFEEIERDITRDAERKFPEAEVLRFHEKAKTLFPLLERGDTIEVEFKADGKTIKGIVRDLDAKSVTINNLPIRIEDLTDASQAYFDVANAARKRDTYVRARTAELHEQRRQYRESLRDSRRAEVLNKAGYILIRGEWISRYAYLNDELVARRQMLYDKLQKLAVFKVYYANGLVFFREQWMTADEAVEIKRLLAEAEAARAAAAAPAPDVFAVPTAVDPAEKKP